VMWPLEYLITKLPVPTKRATVSLFNVKSCSAFLSMLPYVLVAIYSQFWDIHFSVWMPIICQLHVCVSKELRIRGDFSKPDAVREEKVWATLVYPDRFKCSTDILLYRTQGCVAPCAGYLQLMLMHFIQLTVWHHTGMEDIAHWMQ
jgi:hypothetical protein